MFLIWRQQAYDSNEITYVFTANSSRSLKPYIGVWKYEHENNTRPSTGLFQSIKTFLHKVFQVIMVITFAAFLSQNLGYYVSPSFVMPFTPDRSPGPRPCLCT